MKHNLDPQKNASRRSGFTLVELLVAISLFTIAIAVGAGGFIRALRTQRQLIALISANSSVSLAIEQMSRAIRVGHDFECIGVAGTCEELTFTSPTGEKTTYLVEDGTLKIRDESNSESPLTPEDVRIEHLSFTLLGSPLYPPRITIMMSVTARTSELEGNITNLQTTVSSRNF